MEQLILEDSVVTSGRSESKDLAQRDLKQVIKHPSEDQKPRERKPPAEKSKRTVSRPQLKEEPNLLETEQQKESP